MAEVAGAPAPSAPLHPRYRKSSRAPEIEWPPSPQAVTEGEVRRRWDVYQRELAGASHAQAEFRKLTEQLEGYQRLIHGATPTSDMVAVAAAEAGARVVERALKVQEKFRTDADENLHAARNHYEKVWARLRALRRDYEEGERAHNDSGRELTDDELRVEVLDLCGLKLGRW